MQLPLIPAELSSAFKVPGPKTLKLEVNKDETLERATSTAYAYLNQKDCPHNRIEFKYDDCYIVVAKLRGKG
jgi:hypothetical protein